MRNDLTFHVFTHHVHCVLIGPAASGVVPQGLQVEDFCHLEAGRDHALAIGPEQGAYAQARGEVAHAAVEFGDEGHGAEVERGRVDEDGQGLPFLGGQPGRVGHGLDLGRQGLLGVDLAGDVDDAGDGLPGEGFDLFLLGVGDGVGEVEDYHHFLFLYSFSDFKPFLCHYKFPQQRDLIELVDDPFCLVNDFSSGFWVFTKASVQHIITQIRKF